METIMNGGIYIKVKPDEHGNKEQRYLMNNILNESNQKIMGGDCNKINKYNGTEEFYISKIIDLKNGNIDSQNIDLYNCNIVSHGPIRRCAIKELKEKYVELLKFLCEAEYSGKTFMRTKPIYINNKICIECYAEGTNKKLPIVLYKTKYAMLVKQTFLNYSYLEMMNPLYFEDENYKLIGNYEENYMTKKETYKKIIKQIEYRNGQNK